MPLKSGTPSLKRTIVFQISGSARRTIMALWKRINGLDALSERTEFTLILLRMDAGGCILRIGSYPAQIAILEITPLASVDIVHTAGPRFPCFSNKALCRDSLRLWGESAQYSPRMHLTTAGRDKTRP